MTAQLLEKLYDSGVINSKASISALMSLSVSSFCRRRLAVVVMRLKMAETLKEAVTFIEQGHILSWTGDHSWTGFPRVEDDGRFCDVGWCFQDAQKNCWIYWSSWWFRHDELASEINENNIKDYTVVLE